jgi:hypothetical protein
MPRTVSIVRVNDGRGADDLLNLVVEVSSEAPTDRFGLPR